MVLSPERVSLKVEKMGEREMLVMRASAVELLV